MNKDAGTRHDEAEGKLAALASRLVLEVGVAAAQQALCLAACRAERTLLHISALSGGVSASDGVPAIAAPVGRRARRIHALARRFHRQTAARAGATRESEATRPSSSSPHEYAVIADEATQLCMLLTLSRTSMGDCVPQPAVAAGRELLSLLLPRAYLTRYIGVPHFGVPPTVPPGGHIRLSTYPLTLVLYSAAIVVYLLLRLRGHYVEQDTAEMTQLIEAVVSYGSAIPSPNAVHPVYPFGFGFQAVNLYLMRLSGVSIQTLQAWVWPFLLPGMALLAYLAFQEMTGDPRVAALGGLFLFMQPDFLFTVLRGSHEKLTYCLLFAALFLLFRSYRYRGDLPVFAGYVLLFYLVLLGIICTNSFFGSSLIAALTLSFLGGVILSRWLGRETAASSRVFTRLAYVSLSSLLLLLVELLYLYQPSSSIFGQFQSMLDRLAGFVLGFGTNVNPYSSVSLAWSSPAIYLPLTAFTWVTVAISGGAWCRQTVLFIKGGWTVVPDHVRLCWLLYAGLALQVGVGVIIDFAGVLGSNLQLRLFPVYMFIAIPTSSAAVIAVLDRAGSRPRLRRSMRLGMAATAMAFTAFSVLKATNEPLLSNKWTFYSGAEAQTMDWLAAAVPHGGIWTDVDERLREVYLFRSPPTLDAASRYPTVLLPEQAEVVMLSNITRSRMARMAIPLPDLAQMNEIYDNGHVQVYRRLPQTPLQR